MKYISNYNLITGYPILVTLAYLLLVSLAVAQEPVVVTVNADNVVRENNRHLMGHNLSFVEKALGTWDVGEGEFEDTFWQPLKEAAPGMVRFPGGNWTYGYHFDLARKGIKHKINSLTFEPDQDFRPQHFLKLIRDLNDQQPDGIETTPLIHPSAQFTSPEEAAAWVAYMIAPADSNCRAIGADSWGRQYQGADLEWRDTCYWGAQRELDNSGDPAPYAGTLYLQLGNEEWIKSCNGCTGLTDAYGITRHMRAMTIQQEAGIPSQVTAYWPKYRAMWAKLRGPNGLFTASELRVGALGYAGIKEARGAQDRFLNNSDDWNRVLLTNIHNAPDTNLDFLTLNLYLYDNGGWEKHSRTEQRHNLLASHDHLNARIEQIRHQAGPDIPPLSKPIYITEYNTHLAKGSGKGGEEGPPMPLILPSSLLDALHLVNWTAESMYNDAIGGLIRWQAVTTESKANKTQGGYTLFVSRKTNEKIWKMSSFYAARLLAALHPTVVDVAVEEHTGFKPEGFSATSWTWWEGYDTRTRTGPEIPYLTAAATRSADGSELALLLLNRNTVDGYSVSLDLGDFSPASEYTRIELDSIDNLDEGHNDLFDHNTYGANAVEQVALKETEELYHGVIDIGPHQAVVIKLSASLGPPDPNQPPIANAGADQTVNEGMQVILDGSASHDPDPNDVIDSYQWIQTSGPTVTINNPSSAQASFEAPEVTADSTLEFSLTVTDNHGADNTANTEVSVLDTLPANQPPIANAGGDQTVDEGEQVILDGSTSHDPDPSDGIDSYHWIQTSGPTVTINNPSSAQASFEAPEITADLTLEFSLTVTDNHGADNTATTVVSVLDTAPPADPGMIEVLNGDSSNVPIVDFSAGQMTVQVSYGNPEGHPVRGVVQQLEVGDDGDWQWLTAIDETAGEITAGMSPGWVDLSAQVFHYDGKLNNGSWAVSNDQTMEFRIRLKLKRNGSWRRSGNWVKFKIKR